MLETSTSFEIADMLFEAVAAAWSAMGEGEGGLIPSRLQQRRNRHANLQRLGGGLKLLG
jgi:hypothetical protein